MSEENHTSEVSWSEVGDQFRALGETIARAFRATWEREETRQHVDELQSGLEGLVCSVEKAIADFGQSAEGQRLRDEARKAAGSARVAGEQVWADAQPHLVSALRQVNAELSKVTSHLEGAGKGGSAMSEEPE